jgi:hypothetical protein
MARLVRLGIMDGHRLAVWMLIALLSFVIIAIPLDVNFAETTFISSFGPNLPIFGLVFYAWFALIMLTLTSNVSRTSEKVAAIIVFSVVLVGAFVLNAPSGVQVDEFDHLGLVSSVQTTGRANPVNSNLDYLNFPALFILVSIFSSLTGINLVQTMQIYMVFSSAITAALLFMMFLALTGTEKIAGIASTMMLLGSDFGRIEAFGPAVLSFVFLLLMFYFSIKSRFSEKRAGDALSLIVFTAFALSYLPLPLYFLSAMLGIYFIQRIFGQRLVNPRHLLLYWGVFLAWLTFPLVNTFSTLIQSSGILSGGFLGLLGTLVSRGNQITAYIATQGEWASLTRLAWYGLLYVAGSITWLIYLSRRKFETRNATFILGGLVGMGLLTLALFVLPNPSSAYASELFEAQWPRILQLAPLFTLPILFLHVTHLSGRLGRRFLIAVIVAAVLVLSLPSFLIFHPYLPSTMVYSYDSTSVKYIGEFQSSPVTIISSPTYTILYSGFLSSNSYFNGNSVMLLRTFSTTPGALFIFGEEFSTSSHVSVDHAFLTNLRLHFEVYDNGHLSIYWN